MSAASIRVNGRALQAEKGARLLDVLDREGVHVPRLCYDPRLVPSGACRICEVHVEGRSRPPCACATSVEEGMVVETHTLALEHFRKSFLTMLAKSYPWENVARFPEKPLHRYFREYGVEAPEEPEVRDRLVDRTHPYIAIDMHRCIECYRCVHICDDLQGQFVWRVLGHGTDMRVVPDSNTTLLESSCVSCGACVDTCPSGALEDVSLIEKGMPDAWVRTTCPYCGTGCEMSVGVKDDRIVVSRPVLDAPVSKGHLCVKGRYATDFVDASDRIQSPMVRREGKWVTVSWDEALEAAASSLLRIKENYGPDAIGVLGSSRATNEESFVVQKLARVALGTNNVDCCARVCHAPTAEGLGSIFGTGASTNSFNDIERAKAFLVFGCNPTSNHPIVGARIRQRALAGVPLVVVDPKRTELAQIASVHLALRPGTNIPLLHALANVIVEEGLMNRAFVTERTEGTEPYLETLKKWTPERAGEICGVDPEHISKAARIYAGNIPAMCFHGLGVTEHIQGTDGVFGLAHLALLTGNVGLPGAGINPLRGQNNVQGTAVMGCEPDRLTGSQKISAVRERHEKAWGVKLREEAGLNLMQMIDAAGAGTLKGMLIFGYDVALTNPNANHTEKAMAALESVVVVDLFLTKTAEAFGTVFLPVVSSFEKEGTFMNAERRIQRVRRAVSPRGEAKTDLEVTQLLAERLGSRRGFEFTDAKSVWNEVRDLWPAVQGMSYERLDQGGLQWPCPSIDHPGTEVLHVGTFPGGRKARFRKIDYMPSSEVVSEEFPFLLNTGRSLYHFNAATMTGRSRNFALERDDLVYINPHDAPRLQICQGARVFVRSRHGGFQGTAEIKDAIRPGEAFTTFHHVKAMVNRVTGEGRDAHTDTPEFKVTAVSIEPENALNEYREDE
jgi:formate dehydrogenase major subunit